jgi:hypothetical protein
LAVCLHLVYPMLPILWIVFVLFVFVLCTLCCPFSGCFLFCLALSCIPYVINCLDCFCFVRVYKMKKNKTKTIQRIDNIGYTRRRKTKQKQSRQLIT